MIRTFDSDDEFDVKEAKRFRAELWMLDLLTQNPDYVSWGPHEDHMCKKGGAGWESPMFVETWSDHDLHLDDLNEVVNFYFFIDRANVECAACSGTGYGADAKRVSDDFYAFENPRRRWCEKITLDELDALIAGKRIEARGSKVDETFLTEVNDANKTRRSPLGPFSHDAINRGILIEQRCKRLGFPLHCPKCEGEGHAFTEKKARVGLVMWLLHPRKGASRGVEIARVKKSELPAIFAFLKKAAERNAARFAKIGALAK
jgi:hypothetical protein